MLTKSVLVLACATLALAEIVPLYIPDLSTDEDRIVGGTAAAAGEIPWQVSIMSSDGEIFNCGGTIISKDYIITAAHVVDKPASAYSVIAGRLKLSSSNGTIHNVTKITNNAYNSTTQLNDISIWKISPAFVFTNNIKAATLPAQGTTSPAGTNMTVSGWGTIFFEGPLSDALQKVTVPIVAKTTCNTNHAASGGIPANTICAGFTTGGYDACQSDSGGPLVLDGELRGIVSFGKECALPDFPGVYTEVSAFRTWIADITGV